ncbi:MAG: hypothetical protein A2Y17_13610 [Clostridiales bacterium GWF2_38_85]|nr:MAG: hypothetical protein A2Y17_13610 [Clostridiales bacterium GWF2_38_85]
MIFSEKLDSILKAINITNIYLSRKTDIDSSLLSRYRSGARIPLKNSEVIHRISEVIVNYCMETSKTTELKKYLHVQNELSKDALTKNINEWFNNEDSLLKPGKTTSPTILLKKSRKQKTIILKDFSEKINILMNIIDVSNIRLARILNVDSSLISRYRSGMRSPKPDSEIVKKISDYIATCVKSEEQLRMIEIGINKSENTSDYVDIASFIYEWLNESFESTINFEMDNFLDKIDEFHIENIRPRQLSDAYSANNIYGTQIISENFYGLVGIRQAVIKFLSLIINRNKPSILNLYSDQQIDWMSNDEAFTKTWTDMMRTILMKGNKIRIIHHIDRNMNEMLAGIEKWLPVYMTGMIEPYYCNIPEDVRFRRTIFHAPDLASITSSCVQGTERNAEYVLTTDKNAVDYVNLQYEALLSSCTSLMKIFSKHSADKFMLRFGEYELQNGPLKSLLNTLPLYTMPLKLLDSILNRNNISGDTIYRIKQYYISRIKRFEKRIADNDYTELCVIPDIENFSNIRIDICGFILDKPLYYTFEEYKEHIKHIITIIECNPKYKLIPINVSPFKNISVIHKKRIGTVIMKNASPVTVFMVNNQIMCNAFENYLDLLYERAIKNLKDKNIINQLKQYI